MVNKGDEPDGQSLSQLQKVIIEDFYKAEIVNQYENFNAIQMSLMATAYYVKDNFGVISDKELVDIVKSLKPQYKEIVEEILRKAKVIEN